MDISEFSDRTKKFLSEEEIAHYQTDFEPAYMECEGMDKDDFCAALKDKAARSMAVSFSWYILRARENERNAAQCFKDMLDKRDAAEAAANGLRKCIALVQSTCDRALAGEGKSVS